MVIFRCMNKCLSEVPFISDDVTEIIFDNTSIEKYKCGCFPSGLCKLSIERHSTSTDIPYHYFPSGLRVLHLYHNEITKISQDMFPSGLQELILRFNQITEIPKGCFPSGLQELYLSENQITKLNNNCFPVNLRKLVMCNNQITELPHGCFPSKLQELWLSSNRISKISEGCFPSSLQILDISNNKVMMLSPNCFPSKLQKLWIGSNGITASHLIYLPLELQFLDINFNIITELIPNCFPPNLQELNLSSGKISKIHQGCFPSGLKKLLLTDNHISSLKQGLFPDGLLELDLMYNGITILKKGLFPNGLQKLNLIDNGMTTLEQECFPLGLCELNLSRNQIEELPLFLLELINLRKFNYHGNPIEYVHPLVDRWLDRFNDGVISGNNKVYSDSQNIHNSNIQRSLRNSLGNLLKDKGILSLDECKKYIIECNELEEQVKRELLNYCDDKTEHSVYLVTFAEVFRYVISRIVKHHECSELLKILNGEIKDTICKCFTGRMTRLINVLNGFYDDINIQIGSNEQISNIIIMLKEKYEGNELVKQVRDALEEREYDENTINEWLSFVE